MSNFAFLMDNPDFEMFAQTCVEAEQSLAVSPTICAFSARRAFEQAIEWVYLAEYQHGALPDPYDRYYMKKNPGEIRFRKLSHLYHEHDFRTLVNDDDLWKSMSYIIKAGNIAAHRNSRLRREDAVFSLSVLFDFIAWIDYLYGPGRLNQDRRLRRFDENALPDPDTTLDAKVVKEREEAARKAYEEQLGAKDQHIAELEQRVKELSDQLNARRAAQPPLDPIDPDRLNEANTRRRFIDLDLQLAGWDMDRDVTVEYTVTGMEGDPAKTGRIDYLLKGRDGRPLAIIEAKRTCYDPAKGLQQARLYADCIERECGRRPLVFLSNGYETWLADDANGSYRRIGLVFAQDDMQRIMNRRTGATPTADPSTVPVNTKIAGGQGRVYQLEAIQRVCDAINKGRRSMLLAMATGTGKTRVSAALVDVLRRAGLVTNVLFLADRTELVEQAKSDYGEYYHDWSLCNLCGNKDDADAEVVFSTYQTMINAIDVATTPEGKPAFTSGHFDLIIVDEAHRSIFKKYKTIFDHFDAIKVGLTATPRDEVDRNTYEFFELPKRIPTYVYDYETALADGVLVPYRNIEVKTVFMTEGIFYDRLRPEERDRFEEDFGGSGDSAGIADDGIPGDDAAAADGLDAAGAAAARPADMPDHIDAAELNRTVMNANTVDQVLDDLLDHGIRTDGGERLGKTIVFAQNQAHARYIVRRFEETHPDLARDGFIKAVISSDDHSSSIIKEFKRKQNPVIAVSVDMMDTGVDVPEVVNLVFFKRVRSKIKFLQMIGRGTRLCEGLDCVEGVAADSAGVGGVDADVVGVGEAGTAADTGTGEYVGKRRFIIFDYCGNFEFFRQVTHMQEAAMPRSQSEQAFTRKVELIRALQSPEATADEWLRHWRGELVDDVHGQIASWDDTKAAVRHEREYVERYRERKAFDHLGDLGVRELTHELAPFAHYDGDQYALRFDVLMYGLMVAAAGGLGPSVGVGRAGAGGSGSAAADSAGAAGTAYSDGAAAADADTTAAQLRTGAAAPDGSPTTVESFTAAASMTGMATAKSRGAYAGKVRKAVRRLLDRMTIPGVEAQRALIERVANDADYLNEAPLTELEHIRLALRDLIKSTVDKDQRGIIITDLTDPVATRTEGVPFDMHEDYEDYRQRVNRYINEHLEEGAIAKLRHNQPLDADDWSVLEHAFTEELGTRDEYRQTFKDENLGLIVRRIARMDHAAAQEAFAGFIASHTLNGDQIAFMHQVIAYVESNGYVEMSDLLKPPFDRPRPLFDLFGNDFSMLQELKDSVEAVKRNALAPAA